MIRYTISPNEPHKHYIDITATIETRGTDQLEVLLPAWRPGRYELANYAQNIQCWQVFDTGNNPLKSHKISKDKWMIETNEAEEIIIKYNYYANQLTAGDSYFDETQLYVNPINCLVYMQDRINEHCELSLLNLPDHYIVACSLYFDSGRKAIAEDYHSLADSPFIASASLIHRKYTVGIYNFNIWFQGNANPDWYRVLTDFEAFSKKQIKIFGELPVKDYHFLFQLVNHKFYHGVEHLASTVICLGPGYNLMRDEEYSQFLGISSHELFHSWNVKSIRPVEMYPYDYGRENYTTLNYVTEGVTSYYGDVMLLRSGVYHWETYAIKTSKVIDRHQHSYGRLYQTLAEASMDAWLDGYKPGAPARKISFYVKGALVAWLLDLELSINTGGVHNLDSIMKILYDDYAKMEKGYTKEDYLNIISTLAAKDYSDFFEKYINGLDDIIPSLNNALDYVGCCLSTRPNPIYHEDKLGFRLEDQMVINKIMIAQVAPGSPADIGKLSTNDEIVAINDIAVERFPDELLRFFKGSEMQLTLIRNKEILKTLIHEGKESYYPNYQVLKVSNPTETQKQNFLNWSGMEF